MNPKEESSQTEYEPPEEGGVSDTTMTARHDPSFEEASKGSKRESITLVLSSSITSLAIYVFHPMCHLPIHNFLL